MNKTRNIIPKIYLYNHISSKEKQQQIQQPNQLGTNMEHSSDNKKPSIFFQVEMIQLTKKIGCIQKLMEKEGCV